MKIAVDFDGTCVEHQFPAIGKDAPGAERVLKKLVNGGHKIILFTMRSGKFLEEAVDWFVQRNIPLSGINCDPAQSEWTTSPKCYAHLYIDDAGLNVPLRSSGDESRKFVDWSVVEMLLVRQGLIAGEEKE